MKDLNITQEDVEKAISTSKRRKAAGGDGIPNELVIEGKEY